MVSNAFEKALVLASSFRGATAPNPPVGAAVLDSQGQILSVQAHQKAGTAHAEVLAIEDCRSKGLLAQAHTLVVTLEPCNHTGRTLPCTNLILDTPKIRRVVIGAWDPNSKASGGAERLSQAGKEVIWAGTQPELEGIALRCEDLIAPFSQWIATGIPFVTVKTALDHSRPEAPMIPPPGQKTFTSPESLKLSHQLRKRADAIVTGSGTVLADLPEYTVRHVPDHPGKVRWLVVMDRRGRVALESPGWLQAAQNRGFRLQLEAERDWNQTLRFLGEQGVLEVLVEAGPTLSEAILSSGLWNQHVVIKRGNPEDSVEVLNNPCLPVSSKN